MAIVPWILAACIALAGGIVFINANQGISRAESAHQTWVDAHAANLAARQERADQMKAKFDERQTEMTAKADKLVTDIRELERTTDQAQAEAEAARQEAVRVVAEAKAKVEQAKPKGPPPAVSQLVPYSEVLRTLVLPMVDTQMHNAAYYSERDFNQLLQTCQERGAADEADKEIARDALRLLGILRDLKAAKVKAERDFRDAANYRPSTNSSDPSYVEKQREAGVERTRSNAEAEYRRALRPKLGLIRTLGDRIAEAEDAIVAGLESSNAYDDRTRLYREQVKREIAEVDERNQDMQKKLQQLRD